MPEIAEVEIVRRGLERVKGQTLLSFQAGPKLKAHGHEDEIVGRKLEGVLRRGKLLGFDFGDRILLAHLRMTGRFHFEQSPRARAQMRFEETSLAFIDPRGFATMEVINSGRWPMGLGPDLWDAISDPGWLPTESYRKSRRSIKASILDQKVVAGIGNYLADESLWRAAVAPERKTSEVSEKEWRDILESAGRLSLLVLQSGGVTIRDYADTEGQSGSGQARLLVYGRAGEECLRCGGRLQKGRFAGRGTTWCQSCQV